MKTITTFVLLLFFTFTTYSQNKAKIEYQMVLGFMNFAEFNSSLIFDNEKSLFTYKAKSGGELHKNSESSLEHNFTIIDTTTNIILIDKKKNLLFESHNKEKNFFTYEKLPKLKWELLPETKVFKNITCFLAKTNFRGRVYYAWYAPEIPVLYGPWKLYGLPGLIIEAYDEKKEVIFQFSKIQIPYKYDFDTINNQIDKSDKISLLEYLKKNNFFNNDKIENQIKSKFPRGLSVKVEVKRTGVELNFNDLLNDKN